MRKLLLGLIVAIVCVSCDSVEDMRDMLDTQDQLKGLIKESIGVDSLVGFNFKGDALIDVSISLNAEDVADRTVSELKRVVRAAVKKSFDSKPRAIYIQIATTAE